MFDEDKLRQNELFFQEKCFNPVSNYEYESKKFDEMHNIFFAEKKELKKKIDALEQKLKNAPEKEQAYYKTLLLNLKSEKDFLEEQEYIETDKKGKKYFDKMICFSNIRELLKNSHVKIGQIEKASGNTLGYMSRLEKEGNTSDPNIEFLATAANMLNVGLDVLVKGRLAELTPTEKYLLDFLMKILEDTRCETIIWDKETPEELKDNKIKQHPLFEPVVNISEQLPFHEGNKYMSIFDKKCEMDIAGNCYNAILPNVNARLYLMACKTSHKSCYDRMEKCLELYITINNKSKIKPICTTLQTGKVITEVLYGLYDEIEEAATHVKIDVETRNLIDFYMKNL